MELLGLKNNKYISLYEWIKSVRKEGHISKARFVIILSQREKLEKASNKWEL